MLLEYFGEKTVHDCGICSYCISKNKVATDEKLPTKILSLLKSRKMDSREIQKCIESPESDIIFALRDLLENNLISVMPNNQYTLKQ
jgi:ATP-dependent DNA helicase RecQ